MKISFEALKPGQAAEINDYVEKLLWEQGIVVDDPDVCSFFAEKGAGVSGAVVKLPKEMVREAAESAPEYFTLHSRNPERTVTLGIGYDPVINGNSGMSYIQDAGGARRAARVEDQVMMLKLSHTSDVIGVSNAGILYPTIGIDPAAAKYLQMINALTYSDKPFFSQGMDKSYGRAAIDLARIATGYGDRRVCMSVVNSLSPMRWDTKMLGMIRIFAEEDQPLNISSSSMLGATAPLYLTGALIMACAEALFGIVYSQLIRPGAPVVFGCFTGVMDMRNMSMSYGLPEFSIMCAAASQMSSFYKLPFRGGGALTDAKGTNAQCGIESAMQMMVALNCDVHYMHQSIGTLDSILACSAEKFVMDEEIVARIRHMRKGVGEIPDGILDVIREGSRERSFLGLESTAFNFRDIIFTPVFSEGCTYEKWTRNAMSCEDMARSAVIKRLNEYIEPDIDAGIKKDMKEYAAKNGVNL